MKKKDRSPRRTNLAPLDVIRVETALSRYPVHRLAKSGGVCIELREANDQGEMTLRWEVGYHSKYGQPGPLAYKLDTLVVNRRVEGAGKPAPRLIKLGSLGDICRELGLVKGGKIKNDIRHALYQNSSAYITAKVRYRATDGTERSIEIGDTRYAVVFTGENLPDGRTADAVYLVLHDFYREILDHALTRPLDYDYLRELPPAAQRLYELASYPIFGAIKHGRSKAKLAYSEFCLHAPQTRYEDFDRVKKQMHKLHVPHRKSGYITGVEIEATTDREGRPDWTMHYTPGPKARAEHRAFARRGGGPMVIEAEPVAPEPGSEPCTGLEQELVSRGVSRGVATELVRDHPEAQIRIQLANLDGRRRKVKDPGAWLASAIRADFAAPKAIDPPGPPVAPVPMARTTKAVVDAYWRGLGPEEQTALAAAALANADPERRAAIESEARPFMKKLQMSALRDAYLATILGVPAAD